MNIRKIIPVILMLLAVGAALAACMNNDAANVQPDPTANFAPNATAGAAGMNGNSAANNANNDAGMSGNTTATTDGALNPFDWANGAANVEKAIAAVEGVEAVEVSLHEGRASIKGSPSEADVLLAVERIGFKARKATNK